MADENDLQRQKERGDASLLPATNMQETSDKGVFPAVNSWVWRPASVFFSQNEPADCGIGIQEWKFLIERWGAPGRRFR